MIRERLQQLYWIKVEISELSMKIEQLELVIQGGVSRLPGIPRIPGFSDRVGDLVPEISVLKETLEGKLKLALDELTNLEAFIGQIDDAYLRLIFTYRYIKGLSWVQVAHKLGGSTADSVRMMHNRYLQRQNGAEEKIDRRSNT